MMSMIPFCAVSCASLRKRLSRCLQDERGLSAVEFALILPLMVTLYLGGVEVSQGLTIDRKATLVARTVADLAAQSKDLTVTQLNNVLDASTAVMLPYSIAPMKVTVSQILIDAEGNATIDWSRAKTGATIGAGRAKGSTVVVPAALKIQGGLIWAEVSYDYKPVVGYVITGTMKLTDTIYMRPRLSDTVSCPTCG
jgi:Flp pilus assembly protein TadG